MDKPHLGVASRLKHLFLSNQDALVCLFDQGIVSVAGFATSVLIGRLAPGELGVYYIGLSFVLFARGFQQQLVSTPYTIYQQRQSDEGIAAYRGSCLVQQFGFLVLTLIYLIAQVLAANAGWVSTEGLSALVVLLVFLPPVLIREIVRNYCFAHTENTSVLGIDLAVSVFQVLALLVLGYLGFLTGATAWVAIGASCLFALGYWYFRSGPAIKFQKQRLIEDWKLNWSFGKWAVAGQFAGSLPIYLLPLLLLEAAGKEGTGFFAACMTLVGIANIFNTGMVNYLLPKATKVYDEESRVGLRRVMVRMYLLFLVAVGSFALFLSVFGSWTAIKIFGDDYIGLQTVLTLLAVAKLFDSFSYTASAGLFVMERIKANFYVDLILMMITISAAFLLIPNYGLVGAGWTTLVNSSASAILRSGLLSHFLFRESEPQSGGSND